MKADVNAIVVGYRGRCDMLREIFGDGKTEQQPAETPLTQGLFGAVFSPK